MENSVHRDSEDWKKTGTKSRDEKFSTSKWAIGPQVHSLRRGHQNRHLGIKTHEPNPSAKTVPSAGEAKAWCRGEKSPLLVSFPQKILACISCFVTARRDLGQARERFRSCNVSDVEHRRLGIDLRIMSSVFRFVGFGFLSQNLNKNLFHFYFLCCI